MPSRRASAPGRTSFQDNTRYRPIQGGILVTNRIVDINATGNGRLPKLGVPPHDVIKAKGVLLNEVPPPYYVNEEEIPYSGTIVRRSYQRTRWYGGRTFVWIGRTRETGRGVGSSDLRFDQIEPIGKA